MPKVVIANRLTDGRVVFLAAGERWVADINQAQVADINQAQVAEAQVDADALLEIGLKLQAKQQVIDTDLIDVAVTDGVVKPTRPREAIRASGPTTRPDLGKQAGNP